MGGGKIEWKERQVRGERMIVKNERQGLHLNPCMEIYCTYAAKENSPSAHANATVNIQLVHTTMSCHVVKHMTFEASVPRN